MFRKVLLSLLLTSPAYAGSVEGLSLKDNKLVIHSGEKPRSISAVNHFAYGSWNANFGLSTNASDVETPGATSAIATRSAGNMMVGTPCQSAPGGSSCPGNVLWGVQFVVPSTGVYKFCYTTSFQYSMLSAGAKQTGTLRLTTTLDNSNTPIDTGGRVIFSRESVDSSYITHQPLGACLAFNATEGINMNVKLFHTYSQSGSVSSNTFLCAPGNGANCSWSLEYVAPL